MKIGLLTSGGDCPGLNACYPRRCPQRCQKYGYEFVGFRDGWRGVVEGDYMDLPVRRSGASQPRAAPSSVPPAPTLRRPQRWPRKHRNHDGTLRHRRNRCYRR